MPRRCSDRAPSPAPSATASIPRMPRSRGPSTSWRPATGTEAVRNLLLVSALVVAGCSASTADLAPLQWQKVAGQGPNGSVLGLGAAGKFDENGNFTVRAFRD